MFKNYQKKNTQHRDAAATTQDFEKKIPKHHGEDAVLAGQNTGSPPVNAHGILPTPVSPRLTPSSSIPPFRRIITRLLKTFFQKNLKISAVATQICQKLNLQKTRTKHLFEAQTKTRLAAAATQILGKKHL